MTSDVREPWDPLEAASQDGEDFPATRVSSAPALVILEDPDARVDLGRRRLGQSIAERMTKAARAAGFSKIIVGPKLRTVIPDAHELSVDDPIDGPALLVWEGTYVDPELLRLMIEHPLGPDERFALYDAVGRPAACFTGHQRRLPPHVPVAEELDLPDRFGAASVARVVDPEDLGRFDALAVACESRLDIESSSFNRVIGLRVLRALSRTGATVAQLELFSLGLAVAAGPLVLTATWLGLVASGALLFLAVLLAWMLKPLRALGAAPLEDLSAMEDPYVPGETLAELVRPLGHAVFIAACTYELVAATDRSGVAALVLLAAGAFAVLSDLGRVRNLLRRMNVERLALPRMDALAKRLGLRLPAALVQAPLLEILLALSCASGEPAVPWTIAVAAALSRWWPWFIGPDRAPRFSNPLGS